jgi:ribosomal protein S20
MRIRTLLLAASVGLAGCAGAQAISTRASGDLETRVAAVREAAQAGDRDAAAAELEELRGAVDRWVESGQLGPGRAEAILAAVADVESALALLPVPEPSPTPEVEATVEDDDDEDDDEGEGDDDEDDDGGDGDNSGPGGGDSGSG